MNAISKNDVERGMKSAERIIKPKIAAIKRLEAGPAIATSNSPQREFFKLYGLIMTGFAHPIINPAPVTTSRNGKMIEPNISKCGKGFKVNRP